MVEQATDPHTSSPAPTQVAIHAHVCDAPGCSKRFKRRGDLKRHKLSHASEQIHSCSVPNCSRIRPKGFARKDKLIDHMLAGHDEDTLFACPDCSATLTRDLASKHKLSKLRNFRTCPMPRCSFKLVCLANDDVDALQQHLQQKHGPRARNASSDLLKRRGYDAPTAQVLCPACPLPVLFSRTKDFQEHFFKAHYHGPACARHHDTSCHVYCGGRTVFERLIVRDRIADEVRQHRRAIMRIWPAFQWSRVWEDIECPGKTT